MNKPHYRNRGLHFRRPLVNREIQQKYLIEHLRFFRDNRFLTTIRGLISAFAVVAIVFLIPLSTSEPWQWAYSIVAVSVLCFVNASTPTSKPTLFEITRLVNTFIVTVIAVNLFIIGSVDRNGLLNLFRRESFTFTVTDANNKLVDFPEDHRITLAFNNGIEPVSTSLAVFRKKEQITLGHQKVKPTEMDIMVYSGDTLKYSCLSIFVGNNSQVDVDNCSN